MDNGLKPIVEANILFVRHSQQISHVEIALNRNDVTDKLKDFICKTLLNNAAYPLAVDEPLISGGLIDSFSLAQIGVFAEDTFKVYIPDNDLTVANMDTLDQMVNRIMAG